MSVRINIYNKSTKTPSLHKHTSWDKLNDGDYYLKNSYFNSYLIVSIYVIGFLELATGNNSIKQICKKLGMSTSSENIIKTHDLFYKTLYPAGILLEEDVKIKKQKNFIKLSFTILSEKKVLMLSKQLKFLFKRKTVIFILIFCLSIIFYFLKKHNLILNENIKLTDTYNLITSSLLVALVVFLHEIGHSSALCFFEEKPQKIGIGFYLFAPVLFADVTNSWKLDRKKRIIVDVGGLYFQFIITCILLLIFIFTENKTILFSAIISFFIGVFNVNPFMKTDGYWLISDLLNISNLKLSSHTKALSFIKNIIRKTNVKFNYRDYILITYYVISNTFMIAFMIYMLVWNFEMFTGLPENISTIVSAINENNVRSINFIDVESIIIPAIIIIVVMTYAHSLIKKLSHKILKKYLL
jgi:putative peptide zinc metalloprotease protein